MNELILLARGQKIGVIVEHFLDAAIVAFQDKEIEQLQIKTNVGYIYSPSITSLLDLNKDPDYQTFKTYLAEHPVIKLVQGLVTVQNKELIDKGGLTKTKTKACSFDLTLHEDGLHYRLKISDEIKEGVKFNVRVLEAFSNNFQIVEPGQQNRPELAIGNQLIFQLKELRERLSQIPTKIDESLIQSLQEISDSLKEQVPPPSLLDDRRLIGALEDINNSIKERNTQNLASDDLKNNQIQLNTESLENAIHGLSSTLEEQSGPIEISLPKIQESTPPQMPMVPNVDNDAKKLSGWIWTLMIGSIWTSSLFFLVAFIFLFALQQESEWVLLLPSAGFLLVFGIFVNVFRARKNK